MTGCISVYITASSREEADKIGLALIEEGLAACVNIFTGVLSIFRWEGRTQWADECAIVAKTTEDRFDALQKRVKEMHSYKCPCIVATPIEKGDEAFLKWVKDN